MRIGHQFLHGGCTEIGAIVIGLDLKDWELDRKFYGDGVDTEEQDDGRLQLLPQRRYNGRRPGVVDDRYVADIHFAGFEHFCQEDELVAWPGRVR